MLRTLSMVCVAAVIGVTGATFCTCGVGLLRGTGNWCALPLIWFIGFPMAVLSAAIAGFPVALLYMKFGLTKWWQFALGAALIASPIWYALARPFESMRWQQAGLFDSLNYHGSGLFAGLAYWWIVNKFGARQSDISAPAADKISN